MTDKKWRPAFDPQHFADMLKDIEGRMMHIAFMNKWTLLNMSPAMCSIDGMDLSVLSEWRRSKDAPYADAKDNSAHYLMLTRIAWRFEDIARITTVSIYQVSSHDRHVET